MKFSSGAGSEDSKNYVKLKDGESIRGVFRGDIYEFHKHWTGTRTEMCTGLGCEYCKADPKKKPAFRFRLNLITKEKDKDGKENYVAKIFENGWKVYQQLREINSEVPLETIQVKVGRTGSGMQDTTYTVISVPNGNVTPELEAKLKGVALLDLRAADKPDESATEATSTEEDVPF